MSQENRQKIKLLKLYELLQQETDEQNPMTTMMIIDRLESLGISCDRRTLAKDIAVLNEDGYEIMDCRVGKEKGYYIEDRSFSVPELKILIDAVQAASFITEKKTAELVDKLANLGGSHSAEILKSNMVCFNTRKHSNETIYYTIGTLEEAIQQQKKVSFRYYDLNEKGQKVYRKEGGVYVTEPVALVFNEDNYYLVVYNSKYENTTSYRIDRMASVELVDEFVSDKAFLVREEVGCYADQMIKMYGGRTEEITIQFDGKLMGAVYDRFGEDTKMLRITPELCAATVTVQVSPTFWGWIFQFGKMMRITAPAAMVEEYKAKARDLL
ncbi:MAG: WYL domain-containing protein [Firmicutes bacterium]|nr:WYL domain-containing protein [Bacillota bacterium]